MKKVVLEAYTHANLGDDLFIKTICARYPKVKFYLQVAPGFDKGFRSIKNLHVIERTIFVRIYDKLMRLLGRSTTFIKQVKAADAVVMIGGSMFIESNNWKEKLNRLKLIQKNAARFFVLGANFGPYQTGEYLNQFKQFFASAEDVCFRDKKSKQLFSDLTNVRVGSDIVCDLAIRQQECVAQPPQLSLIPIDLTDRSQFVKYQEKYISKMQSLVKVGIQQGYQVVLQAFCLDQNDNKAIKQILNGLPHSVSSKVKVVLYQGDIQSALDSLSKAQLIITTRFHGMILGWLFGANVIPISYDIKMDNLLADINFKGSKFSLTHLDELNAKQVLVKNKTKISKDYVPMQYIKKNYESPFKKLDQILN